MRRVVVAVDEDGLSIVASDEEIPDTGRIWSHDPKSTLQILEAIDPAAVYRPAQPPPSGVSWYLSEMPPGKGMESVVDPPPGMDAHGFHVTKTVDFIFMLSGSVLLDLDRVTVELGPGDAVVLQAGSHAWRNPTSEPARFLDVLVSGES